MNRQVSRVTFGSVVVATLLLGAACAPSDGLDETTEPASVTNTGLGTGLSIRVDRDTASVTYGSLVVVGLDAEAIGNLQARNADVGWEAFFRVYTENAGRADASMPPMLGTYTARAGEIRFTPRFPFVPGLAYRVHFDGATLARDVLEAEALSIPVLDTLFVFSEASTSRGPLTSVSRVYPTTDTIPANLLKMYLYFTAPMSEGYAYANLRLIDLQSGEAVKAPFLEMEPELWDPERKRFTLFFDPGRIKRLVGPNVDMGQPLREGRSYRLEIDRAWPDAKGRPLEQTTHRDFYVTSTDREKIDPRAWHISLPAASTRDPLVVDAVEPMDHALFERAIRIVGPGGEAFTGRIEVGDMEKRWQFIPASPWLPGAYEIHIAAYLEDLAGNTFQSLFDVDLMSAPPSEVREAEDEVVLTFDIDPITE